MNSKRKTSRKILIYIIMAVFAFSLGATAYLSNTDYSVLDKAAAADISPSGSPATFRIAPQHLTKTQDMGNGYGKYVVSLRNYSSLGREGNALSTGGNGDLNVNVDNINFYRWNGASRWADIKIYFSSEFSKVSKKISFSADVNSNGRADSCGIWSGGSGGQDRKDDNGSNKTLSTVDSNIGTAQEFKVSMNVSADGWPTGQGGMDSTFRNLKVFITIPDNYMGVELSKNATSTVANKTSEEVVFTIRDNPLNWITNSYIKIEEKFSFETAYKTASGFSYSKSSTTITLRKTYYRDVSIKVTVSFRPFDWGSNKDFSLVDEYTVGGFYMNNLSVVHEGEQSGGAVTYQYSGNNQQNIIKGDTVKLNAVTYDNYYFLGWYIGNDLLSISKSFTHIVDVRANNANGPVPSGGVRKIEGRFARIGSFDRIQHYRFTGNTYKINLGTDVVVSHANPFVLVAEGDVRDNYTNDFNVGTYNYNLTVQRKNASGVLEEVGRINTNKMIIDPLLAHAVRGDMGAQTMYNQAADWAGSYYDFTITTGDSSNGTDGKILKSLNAFFQYSLDGGTTWTRISNAIEEISPDGNRAKYRTTQRFSASSMGTGAYKVMFRVGYDVSGNFKEIGRTQKETKNTSNIYSYENTRFNAFLDTTVYESQKLTVSGYNQLFDSYQDELNFYTNNRNFAITLNLSGFGLSGALIEFQFVNSDGTVSQWLPLISGDGLYFNLANGAPRYNNISGNAENNYEVNGDYRLTFSQDYKYLIRFKATGGNTISPSWSNVNILNEQIAIYVDFSSPHNDNVEYPGIVSLNGSQNGWVAETINGDIVAKFNFTDGDIGSGVKEIRLNKNSGNIKFNLNGIDLVDSVSDQNIISKNGSNTIEITIVDAEEYFIEIEDFIGNIKRLSVAQRVDIFTPDIKNIEGYQSGQWTNNDVTLTFTVDCGPSGVEIGYMQGDQFVIFYQDQQPVIPTGIGTGEQIGHKITIVIADPQNTEYNLIARSQAGRLSESYPITIKIDKTKGEFVSKTQLGSNEINEWRNAAIPITMEIADIGNIVSGIKSVILYNDNKETVLNIEEDNKYRFLIKNPLKYKVVVTDNAGNTFETEYKARVNLIETVITVDAFKGNTSTKYDFNTWLNLDDKTNGNGFVKVVFNIEMGATPLILSYRKDNGDFVNLFNGDYLGSDGFVGNFITQNLTKEWTLSEEQNSSYDIMYILKDSLVTATTPLNKLASVEQYNKILIDTTPPEVTISYVNNENAGIAVNIENWVYFNVRADFEIDDSNGSGIDVNKTLYVDNTLIGDTRYVFTETKEGGYDIVIIDKANNIFTTVISPKIDKFDDFVLNITTDQREGFVPDTEKWVSKNVEFDFLFTDKVGNPISCLQNPSQFKIYYSITRNGEYKESFNFGDVRQAISYSSDNTGAKLLITADQSSEYRFILRTGAGREFVMAERYWGVYKDATKASLSFDAKVGSAEYLSEWTYNTVNFNLTTSKSQSGVKVDYIIVSKEAAATASGLTGDTLAEFYKSLFATNTVIGISRGIELNKFEYSLSVNKDCLEDYYIFRISTGAGIETFSSDTTKDALNLPFLVKIDTVSAYFTSYEIKDKNGVNYNGTNFTDGKIEAFIYGAKSGPSGYKVVYAEITSEDYITIFEYPNVSGSVVFEDNQNIEYIVAIFSGAGKLSEDPPTNTFSAIPLSVKIDKVQAEFDYSVSGTKLTENVVQDNLNWYISDVVVTFNLTSATLLSGHFFEYAISNDGINFQNYTSEGIANQGESQATLTIKTNKNAPHYYKFRIRNGANVVGDVKEITEIKVDTTKYLINVEQYIGNVLGLENAYGYVLQIDKSGGYENQVNFTEYKRGDKLEVLLRTSPKTVSTETGNERLWNYFKSYQVIGASNNTIYNWDIDFNNTISGDNIEHRGAELNFEIIDSDVKIILKYVREVLLDFENLEQSIQNSTVKNVNVLYPETDFKDIFSQSLNIVLRYYYFDDSENTPFADIVNNRKIGKYRIEIIYNNNDFYIKGINNKDYSLNLSYFVNNGTDIDNFIVDSAEAFNHIDYYMSEDEKYSYLKKDYQIFFRQTIDLQKDKLKKLVNPFTGYYDGANHEILAKNIEITESVFSVLKGATIKNLGFVYNLSVVRPQEYVGLISDQIIAGEENNTSLIENVYGIGIINVISLTQNKINYIGGLFGKANNVTFRNVFADVSLDQIKNTSITTEAYIGGVVGYIDGLINVIGLYTLSPIAVYNLPNAKIGGIFGYSSSLNVAVNIYILKNNITIQNVIINSVTSAQTSQFNAQFSDFNYFNNRTEQLIGDSYYENKANKTVAALSVRKIKDIVKLNSGQGTVLDPVQLSDEKDLDLLEKLPYANFVLIKDITLKNNFNKVYNYYKVFNGTITAQKSDSGDYYAIYNYNYTTDSNNSSDVIALIAYSVGKIENVNLLDIVLNINVDYTKASVTASGLVGILFDGGSIKNSIVSGYITVNNKDLDAVVGGVVGKISSAELNNVISLVNVNIENSKQLIAGGILGVANNGINSNSNLDKLYSLSKVSALYDESGAVGNIIGYVMNPQIRINRIYYINDNTFIGSVANNVFIGYNKVANITSYGGYNYNEFLNQREGNNVFIKDIVKNIYPFESGLGTTENPFVVVNENQLSYISNYLYAHYILGADISLSDNFETIGKGAMFTGSLSGNVPSSGDFMEYYAISNLRKPLFENNAGNLESFKLNVFVASGNDYYQTNGEYIFGSLAKYNYGSINTVTLSGTVHVANQTTENVVVGGLVGIGYGGTIKACINGIDIKVNSIYGEVGGIIGRVEGNSVIENNKNVEAEHGITASDIVVNGNIKAGLIVGLNRSNEAIIKKVELNNTVIINGLDKGSEHYIGYDLYNVLQ